MSKEKTARMVNKRTGVAVSVRESKAGRLGPDWGPVKAAAKPKSDKK